MAGAKHPTTTLVNKTVGTYGYGLMGLTWRQSPPPQQQAFTAMKTAFGLGATFWNGGEFYGPPNRNSLVLLNEYFQAYPDQADKIVLSVKGGGKNGTPIPDGSRENTRRTVLDSLAQLQANGVKKTIDIFEFARVDPKTPVEETIGYLAELVKEGKIGGIGLSEVKAETIRRASKVHKISAVEVEMSLWTLDILHNGVAAACGELGIPIVAYSPLGRGALTGDIIRKNADIPDNDPKKHYPKFQDDVLEVNFKIVEEVEKIAKKKGVSMTQIALAFVKGYSYRTIKDQTQGGKEVKLPEIIPIPGATTEARVTENIRPDIVLSETEFNELKALTEKFPVAGDRYPAGINALSEG